MGNQRFLVFTRELMNLDHLTAKRFIAVIASYLPDEGEALQTWLTTTDYPDRLFPEIN